MNKNELVAKVSEKHPDTPKKEITEILNSILGTVGDALVKGEDVTFVGFGTFKVTERKARTGRNPQTGKEIKIAAKKVPTFKAGKALKDIVA